jgi:hypothetical protein
LPPLKAEMPISFFFALTLPVDFHPSMEKIISGMLSSRVPIVVYVAPSGSKTGLRRRRRTKDNSVL